ncbi:MAG: hypothetical protein AAGF12_27865 [Myxococcota bacterium]
MTASSDAPIKPYAQDAASLSVYGMAASAAAAVPVPLVDRWLGRLARGAALRRVCRWHGVRLTPRARQVLTDAGSDLEPAPQARTARLAFRVAGFLRDAAVRTARNAAARVIGPAARVDDGLSAVSAAVLLDHYLRSYPRPSGPLLYDEANRLRRAIDSAEVRGAVEALRSAPRGVLRTLYEAMQKVAADDPEDRTPVERVADHLLDAAADIPEEVTFRLERAFDRAWAET